MALISQLGTRAGNFAGVVLLARLLSPAGYGIYALAIAAQATLALTAGSYGLGVAASKSLAEARTARDRRETVSTVLWCSIAMSLLVAVIFVPVGPLWAVHVVGTKIGLAFTLLCGLIAITQLLSTVSAGLLRGERRITLFGVNNIAFAGLTTVGAVALASRGALGALLGVVLGGVVAVAIGTRLAWSAVGKLRPLSAGNIPVARYREIIGVGGPALIAPLLYLPATLFAKSLLTVDHGPASLASLQIAENINQTVLLAMQSINVPLLPAISRLAALGDTRALHDISDRAVRGCIAVAGPVAILVAFTAPFTVPLVFGPSYGAEAARVVFVMVAAALALGIATVLQNILIARGRMRAFLISYACDAAVLAFVALVMIPRVGAIGAAIAVLCGGSVRLLVSAALVSRGSSRLTRRTSVMGTVVAVSFFVGIPLDWDPSTPVIEMLKAAVLIAATYALVSLLPLTDRRAAVAWWRHGVHRLKGSRT